MHLGLHWNAMGCLLNPFAPCALPGHNTNLPSDSNIWKTVRVNIAFSWIFLKEYSTSFLMVCRLIDIALVVLKLLMFNVCEIIGISKIEFFNFLGNERVNLVPISDWLLYQKGLIILPCWQQICTFQLLLFRYNLAEFLGGKLESFR